MSSQPRKSLRLCADVRYRVVADQAVIIVQKAGEAIVLNEVGTRVLDLLAKGLDREEIAADLERHFDAASDRIARDLEAYLTDLREAGVIEASD